MSSHLLLLFRCILNIFDWRLGTFTGASGAAVLLACDALPKCDGVGAFPYGIGTLPIVSTGSEDAVSPIWGSEADKALPNLLGAKPGIFGGGLNAASSPSSCSVLIHFFLSESQTI